MNHFNTTMRQGRTVIFGLLVSMLSGCAANLPAYRPYSDGAGYQEKRIEKNRYALSFTGNSSMTAEATENYLIYRAAEISDAAGYDYFVLHDKSTKQKSRYRYFPSSHSRYGYYNSWGYGYGHHHFDYYNDYCCPYSWYEVGAEVLMYEGQKPEGDLNAYDSEQVIEYLGPSIRGVRNVMPANSPSRGNQEESFEQEESIE
ncbi:MAG: hypothetical protein V3V18_15070 [Methylococcales bacterium]